MPELILKYTAQFPSADGNLRLRDQAYKMLQFPNPQSTSVPSLLKDTKDKSQQMNHRK